MAKKTVTAWVGLSGNSYIRVAAPQRGLAYLRLKEFYGPEMYADLLNEKRISVVKAKITWEDK